MPSLSFQRLEQVLDELGIDQDEVIARSADPAATALLVEGCRMLGQLQQSIDKLEDEIGSRVGWPRLGIELDHRDLVFVSSEADIDALVQIGRLSAVDAGLLKVDLAQQQGRWRHAAIASGLARQRRREIRFARHLSRSTADLIRSHPNDPPSAIWVLLVIIIATMEPGDHASALLDAVAHLRLHLAK